MHPKPSYLVLEDGTRFDGLSPAWVTKTVQGEIVFTTGMTGYTESLTDPSYRGQILVFTYPLMGNYGVPRRELWESGQIHARGAIMCTSCSQWSHAEGERSLEEWLREQDVALLTDVDTRALTKKLRETGTMRGVICSDPKECVAWEPTDHSVVRQVSCTTPQITGSGKHTVVVVDCGIKENILRCLERLPVRIKRVPYNYDFTREPYDGVCLSNGPGDPSVCTETIALLAKAMKQQKPIFGICLGAQLLALAAGAKTYKLPYGHRSHNQPCVDTGNGRCYVTSQNHGYAIDEKTLPPDWRVSHRNLNDNSVEGITHATLPFWAVQFHPEASPGPTDTMGLFERFYRQLQR